MLRNYVSYAEKCGDEFVSCIRAIEWAGQTSSLRQRRDRLATLRHCAIMLHAEDGRHEVPPVDVFGHERRRRPAPHLYTSEQIELLMDGASHMGPSGSIRPLAYATLFGLLAATGLRVSEALSLRVDDVKDDGLFVNETKFKKSRLVPIHESTRAALDLYMESRKKLSVSDRLLFVSTAGNGIRYRTAIGVFLGLARRIGLRGEPGTRGHRLQDLRHTFAVRSLEQCAGDRKSILRHMTGLSTYLGHAHVSDTYWYLEATPILLQQIAQAGERLYTGDAL
jgi:integrase